MAIPINIEDILNKRKIESNRIEFKKDGILIRSIVPFALLPMILIISVEDILS